LLEQQVKQFNDTYKATDIHSTPTVPTKEQQSTFGELIMEEVAELALAFEREDPVETFDAILDIIYVTAQQGHLYGYPIEAGLREVHRSNMSKLGEDGLPILREDGKVLKGPNFSPPDLKGLLE
jgi:predicted HAD superfamily Cof-like phosphohydrolase